MAGPTIKDVTEAICPDDRPHKCLPYGTCYGPDSYCNQQYGDVVSCFPLELRNNITKILNWCRDVQQGIQSPLNSACQFACEYRFNYSELNIASTTPNPESTWADCGTIVRDVTSCPLPDKGNNQTNLLNWCNDLLQQNTVSANHSNNHSVIGTDTSHDGTSSDKLLVWFIVVGVILVLSLILNVFCFYKKYRGGHGSYRVVAAENIGYSKKNDDDAVEKSLVEEEDHRHRRGDKKLHNVKMEENHPETQKAARERQEMDSVQGFPNRQPSPMPGLQIRNSISQARGDNLTQENPRPTGNSPHGVGTANSSPQNATVIVAIHPDNTAHTDDKQEEVTTTKE